MVFPPPPPPPLLLPPSTEVALTLKPATAADTVIQASYQWTNEASSASIPCDEDLQVPLSHHYLRL